ncbi:hypothetical protein D3C84_839250 [compost metagenome]
MRSCGIDHGFLTRYRQTAVLAEDNDALIREVRRAALMQQLANLIQCLQAALAARIASLIYQSLIGFVRRGQLITHTVEPHEAAVERYWD